MSVAIVAAMSENRVIGKDGKLPWHLSKDLQYFKKLTAGSVMIMGRKTFDSIGCLPGRMSLVVTGKSVSHSIQNDQNVHNETQFPPLGLGHTLPSLDRAISDAAVYMRSLLRREDKPIFIIGGGQIYRQAIHSVDTIYLTVIHNHYKGDTYFPEIPEIFNCENVESDHENGLWFSFLRYTRREHVSK